MKNLSGQESLWVAFPILIVLTILVAGIIFLPRIQTEIRSKASEPAPALITPTIKVQQSDTPEVVCSELYAPVCGVNGKTYTSACEANLAGVTSYIEGKCLPAKVVLPATN